MKSTTARFQLKVSGPSFVASNAGKAGDARLGLGYINNAARSAFSLEDWRGYHS